MAIETRLLDTARVIELFSGLLNEEILDVREIQGGRNSRCYLLDGRLSGQFFGKVYFHHELDKRNRCKVEFSSLEFLWTHGVRAVPEPIAADMGKKCAAYRYVEGDKILSNEVTIGDVRQAVRFLEELNSLSHIEASRCLQAASEACFSPREIVANIGVRLNRLMSLQTMDSSYRALRRFLEKEFKLSFEKAWKRCEAECVSAGISVSSELAHEERTLSPSDFGFHNTLRRKDGRIVFVDFEYFGWDDPAKLVCDFLLHPGMTLSETLRCYFLDTVVKKLGGEDKLSRRVRILYPLFGLQWCMILLNEFVAGDIMRRQFACSVESELGDLQAIQLAKARTLLKKCENEYETSAFSR